MTETATTETATDAPEVKKTPRRPARTKDLSKVVDPNKAIIVKNQLNNIVVFNLKIDGAVEESEWKPSGDRDGEDVMELPSTYLLNARFRETLNKGILKIIDADDPEVVEAFDAQVQAYKEAQERKNHSDYLIEGTLPRAFSGTPCIAKEGGRPCPEYALSSNNTNERPPLCQHHQYLAGTFVPEVRERLDDNGKPVTNWVPVRMTE